jgi:hypothetical protein
MPDDILTLNGILKSGLSATDTTLSGTLTPKQGKIFASAIAASSTLLGKITTDIVGKLTKERTGWDAAKGQLTRHKSGVKAPETNEKKLGKIGCKLDMTRGVELNASILDDAIEENQDNPNFEQEQFDIFTTIFSNDLLHLGIIGESDSDDHDADFKDLAKGWLMIASESDDTNITTTSNPSILHRLKWLVKNAHEDVMGTASILMSPKDYMDYQFEIAETYKDLSTILNADKKTFMQLPIESTASIPSGDYLLTPLKNMVLGLSSTVKRNRWYENSESALKYKFVVYPDYEFDIHKYVTYMTTESFDLSVLEKTVAEGSTTTVTVENAAGEGLAGITVLSKNSEVATATYNSETGVITITGVTAGTATVTVDDKTSTRDIVVTVTA